MRGGTTNRLCQSPAVNLLEYRDGVLGDDEGHKGSEGGSPALLLAHLRSGCAVKAPQPVINGQRLQINRRVCSVEKSQRRKEKNEVGILYGGEIQPSVPLLLRRSRPNGPLLCLSLMGYFV